MDFLGSDKSVVQRTQHFNYHVLNQRPVKSFILFVIFLIKFLFKYFLDTKKIQYVPYFQIKNIAYTFAFIIFGLMFGVLANFKFGRSLLLKVLYSIIFNIN